MTPPSPDAPAMPVPAAGPRPATQTLLLVDDEEYILSALRRLLRTDGYRILTAPGGEDALATLSRENVDVILSDQRMPGMTGTELLRRARDLRPDTIRIVLSGYTELESVTSAINEGSVYKFLTKPWNDEQLRANVAEAFRRKHLDDENQHLHRQLHATNEHLLGLLRERQELMALCEISLKFAHETIALLPNPVLGVDTDEVVVLANQAALALLGDGLLGLTAREVLPSAVWTAICRSGQTFLEVADGRRYCVMGQPLGTVSHPRGILVTLTVGPEPSP